MSAQFAVLIVTLERRRQFYARLMRRLEPQLSSRVEVYTLEDEGAESIGRKRQRLIEAVSEPYLAFVDDDDMVAKTYCADILRALKKQPDVVGFHLRYYEDGKYRGRSLHSVQAREWATYPQPDGSEMHFRTPNHLNPVRREMALKVGYKPLMTGEDSDYSHRLFAMFPNMQEVFIDKFMYTYLYRSPRLRHEGEDFIVPDIA